MTLSSHDKANVGRILAGYGDWFSAELLRLIAHADKQNRERLWRVYPDHVEAYEAYLDGLSVRTYHSRCEPR